MSIISLPIFRVGDFNRVKGRSEGIYAEERFIYDLLTNTSSSLAEIRAFVRFFGYPDRIYRSSDRVASPFPVSAKSWLWTPSLQPAQKAGGRAASISKFSAS
jgi:hypothetical protein